MKVTFDTSSLFNVFNPVEESLFLNKLVDSKNLLPPYSTTGGLVEATFPSFLFNKI